MAKGPRQGEVDTPGNFPTIWSQAASTCKLHIRVLHVPAKFPIVPQAKLALDIVAGALSESIKGNAYILGPGGAVVPFVF